MILQFDLQPLSYSSLAPERGNGRGEGQSNCVSPCATGKIDGSVPPLPNPLPLPGGEGRPGGIRQRHTILNAYQTGVVLLIVIESYQFKTFDPFPPSYSSLAPERGRGPGRGGINKCQTKQLRNATYLINTPTGVIISVMDNPKLAPPTGVINRTPYGCGPSVPLTGKCTYPKMFLGCRRVSCRGTERLGGLLGCPDRWRHPFFSCQHHGRDPGIFRKLADMVIPLS